MRIANYCTRSEMLRRKRGARTAGGRRVPRERAKRVFVLRSSPERAPPTTEAAPRGPPAQD